MKRLDGFSPRSDKHEGYEARRERIITQTVKVTGLDPSHVAELFDFVEKNIIHNSWVLSSSDRYAALINGKKLEGKHREAAQRLENIQDRHAIVCILQQRYSQDKTPKGIGHFHYFQEELKRIVGDVRSRIFEVEEEVPAAAE